MKAACKLSNYTAPVVEVGSANRQLPGLAENVPALVVDIVSNGHPRRLGFARCSCCYPNSPRAVVPRRCGCRSGNQPGSAQNRWRSTATRLAPCRLLSRLPTDNVCWS
jgi:hypothetical protein